MSFYLQLQIFRSILKHVNISLDTLTKISLIKVWVISDTPVQKVKQEIKPNLGSWKGSGTPKIVNKKRNLSRYGSFLKRNSFIYVVVCFSTDLHIEFNTARRQVYNTFDLKHEQYIFIFLWRLSYHTHGFNRSLLEKYAFENNDELVVYLYKI